MVGPEQTKDFTVYLEGQEGHQGNVLLHAFIAKVHRIELVLHKLERAYLAAPTRRTDFEIIAADKRNPTTLTLKPVPRVKAYNPTAAFRWGIGQIATVARGEMPDVRVNADIAGDLVKLATPEEDGFKAFWINGHSEEIRFDEEFLARAMRVARQRAREEAPNNRWHTGTAIGSVVGELLKVDDVDEERQLVIVPPAGADAIPCTFPESMRADVGSYLFRTVRVTGTLFYGEGSPFPFKVEAQENGIEFYPPRARRRNLSELRGVFAGKERLTPDWDSLLDGR